MMPISAKEIQRSFLKFIVSLRTGRKLKERLLNSERLSAVIEICTCKAQAIVVISCTQEESVNNKTMLTIETQLLYVQYTLHNIQLTYHSHSYQYRITCMNTSWRFTVSITPPSQDTNVIKWRQLRPIFGYNSVYVTSIKIRTPRKIYPTKFMSTSDSSAVSLFKTRSW